ncbi:hypothetical protein LEP1GSC178_0984 [Leptospira licerasiae str. MMD4847]|uniref:Transposase n=1 Tax=Leptospira licerasiae str. MMD4847 TaxID=1049971 RepID=A0ABP2RCL9_9LEPT|nr:hypothetical protein LEP1GSC178_0984 [Leptospira licerasiae str. MMD4847]
MPPEYPHISKIEWRICSEVHCHPFLNFRKQIRDLILEIWNGWF